MRSHLLAALIVLLSACGSLLANPPRKGYFCVDEGVTLRYERREPGSGRHWWTQTTTIDSVRLNQDGSLLVSFTAKVTGVKEKSPFKGPLSTEALIRNDGTVEIDIASSAKAAAKQRFSAFNFKSSGETSILSADAAPGDKLKDIHAKVSWKNFGYTLDYTERKVIRKETITVPAGTFECIVVEEMKTEKGPLINKPKHKNLNWYSLGYGLVRHDSFYPDGTLKTSEILVSVKR